MTLTNYKNGLSSMGIPLTGSVNPFGSVWFVAASGGSDGNSGTDTGHPFATIQQALDKSATGDTVVLGPGSHEIDTGTDGAMIPLADMQFVAAIPPMGGKPSSIITADADDLGAMVTIDVDGVGFHGIEFLLVAGGATAVDLFDVSQTTAVTGLLFNDCWFNLNSVDKAGFVRAIAIDDATNATTGLAIKNCRFLGGDATTGTNSYIQVGIGGIPKALIEGCTFELEAIGADVHGIDFLDPTAAAGSYAFVIRNNDFIGSTDAGGDSVGIKIATASTDAEIIGMMRTNYFADGAANPITKDQGSASQVENYRANGAGGAIFDPLT